MTECPLFRSWDPFRSDHCRLEGNEYQYTDPQTRLAPIPTIRFDGLDSRFRSSGYVEERVEQMLPKER